MYQNTFMTEVLALVIRAPLVAPRICQRQHGLIQGNSMPIALQLHMPVEWSELGLIFIRSTPKIKSLNEIC
jgi:hypothetical protein